MKLVHIRSWIPRSSWTLLLLSKETMIAIYFQLVIFLPFFSQVSLKFLQRVMFPLSFSMWCRWWWSVCGNLLIWLPIILLATVMVGIVSSDNVHQLLKNWSVIVTCKLLNLHLNTFTCGTASLIIWQGPCIRITNKLLKHGCLFQCFTIGLSLRGAFHLKYCFLHNSYVVYC